LSTKIHMAVRGLGCYINDLERGARNPTITVVDKLATALSVTPGRLLD